MVYIQDCGVYQHHYFEVYCLKVAVEYNAMKCAKLLIQHGADPHKNCESWPEIVEDYEGIKYCFDEKDDDEDDDDFYNDILYLPYNSIQVANLTNNWVFIDKIRNNEQLRKGFRSIHRSASIPKAYLFLLCVQRCFAFLPQEMRNLICSYILGGKIV